MNMTHNSMLDAIEEICDAVGPKDLVCLVAEVFSTKADHIDANWQDHPLADTWNECAGAMLNAYDKIPESI